MVSNTALLLLAVYGLTYALKEAELLDVPRNWIMRSSVFFYRLFQCYYCLGFWSSLIVFGLDFFSLHIVIFVFAGAAAAKLLSVIVFRLL